MKFFPDQVPTARGRPSSRFQVPVATQSAEHVAVLVLNRVIGRKIQLDI